jgi:hypothetical protein
MNKGNDQIARHYKKSAMDENSDKKELKSCSNLPIMIWSITIWVPSNILIGSGKL